MGRRKPAPVVPPTKAQVVEGKTLQLGEFRFETCGGRRVSSRDGRRSRFWRGRRAVSFGLERNVLRMPPSPFRCIRVIDDDIGARALIFRLAPIDLEPALSQACQRGPGGMGKPAHCSGQLVDRRAALASQKANDCREF